MDFVTVLDDEIDHLAGEVRSEGPSAHLGVRVVLVLGSPFHGVSASTSSTSAYAARASVGSAAICSNTA